MNGLSSTAFANATNFAQPMPSASAVLSAVRLIARPNSFTASMSMPARVEATLTDEHRNFVEESASGSDSMSFRSEAVIPFCTSAE